jgi:hypothetical protein
MRPARDEPARLIHDHRVRVLNCSVSGCLLETTRPLPVNTVATLQVLLGGRTFEDIVQVVRCQAIPAGGTVHHVATRFLSVVPLVAGSLRYVLHHQTSELAGWLSRPNNK